MKSLILALLLLGPDVGLAATSPSSSVFRFTLSVEPNGADPARLGSSEAHYFLVNVLKGLYVVDKNGVEQPEIGRCVWTGKESERKQLRCEIKKGARWSDGEPIRAKDFLESWQRLLAPGAKGAGASVLSTIENAAAIHKGSAQPETLGVKVTSERVLEIKLQDSDPEFLQRLAHPALVATRSGFTYDRDGIVKAPVSGPYKVVEWKTGGRIKLESNSSYSTIQNTKYPRPPVEILVVEDDETAINLYREGTLTFLRRLPTHYLRRIRETNDSKMLADLHQIPVVRFDYVGFGPALRQSLEFRQALASALNYEELRILYSALGIPGCPSIEPKWMTDIPCHKFDLAHAKAAWEKVPNDLKTKRWTLHFSKLGGDDIQKGMEWIQSQWKKNLGLNIELKAVEQGVYLQSLRTNTPDLFRKGVGLDRSTCLAAVEIFEKSDPENFIQLDRADYQAGLAKLRTAQDDQARRKACTELIRVLIRDAEIIPLGRIHFSLLAKPQYQGWVLNPLNHLDLSRLHLTRK